MGGAFGTHQFLCQKAYEKLSKHPAFSYVKFPSIEEIVNFSGVRPTLGEGYSLAVVGEGPDNPEKSYFSWHYYNPITGKGDAPMIIGEYYEMLRANMEDRNDDARDPLNDNLSPAARNAAYLGHYIQDMACIFHVAGMPRSGEIKMTKLPGTNVTGTFRIFDYGLWKKVTEEANKDTHGKTDWFDPNYYDGSTSPVKGSSHYSYEAFIEVAYKNDAYFAKSVDDLVFEKESGVSPLWDNSENNKAVSFAKKMASETRGRIDSREPDAWFDTETYQKDMALAVNSINLSVTDFLADVVWVGTSAAIDAKAREIFDAIYPMIKKHITVPYTDWNRAIQGTYTLWRASFSAVVIKPGNIELRRMKDKENSYKLWIRVDNVEPDDDAVDVKVSYNSEGAAQGSGSKNAGTINKSSETEWLELSGELYVKDQKLLKDGEIHFKIESKFNKAPDSGVSVFVVPAKDIRVEEPYKMPDVVGSNAEWAKGFLAEKPYELAVTVNEIGYADAANKAFTVSSQTIEPGTFVEPGDAVTLDAYTKYMIEVPDVVGKNKKQAIKELLGKFNPASLDIPVESGQVPDIVIEQEPAGKSMAEPGSDVIIKVSKPKTKPPVVTPPEGAEDSTAGEGEKEPQGPEEDVEIPIIADIVMSPGGGSAEIGKYFEFTAVPIDIEGKAVSEKVFNKLDFTWFVNDPGVATIASHKNAAIVSGIKEGNVNVICTAGGAMGIGSFQVTDKEGIENVTEKDDEWTGEHLDNEQEYMETGEIREAYYALFRPVAPKVREDRKPKRYDGEEEEAWKARRKAAYESLTYSDFYFEEQSIEKSPLILRFDRAAVDVYKRENFTQNSKWASKVKITFVNKENARSELQGTILLICENTYDSLESILSAFPGLRAKEDLKPLEFTNSDGTALFSKDGSTATVGPIKAGWTEADKRDSVELVKKILILIDCFITTAVYGYWDQAKIDVFRRFRDEIMLKTELGTRLVDLYYEHGPHYAEKIYDKPGIKRIIRFYLDIIGYFLKKVV